MPPPQDPHDLARSLIASEAEETTGTPHTEPATVRVYERMRRQLGAPVGADGFHALASRALALAKSESPRLSTVQITADGGLGGFEEIESQTDTYEDGEAGLVLIAQLLRLFLHLLGETATLSLIDDLRLQVDIELESAVTTNKPAAATDGPAITAAFEDLMAEIDRLRSVSKRIEILASKHPDMEEGLVSVAANIRSIATVLDVFTLIRSRAGGPQEGPLNLQTNPYMN